MIEREPGLTREQVRRIDQLAVERYGIPSLVLMENAGKNAAAMIRDVYGPAGSASIFCGTGNNGGDGCVIARHLHNANWSVRVVLAGEPSRLTPDAKTNFAIVGRMNVHVLAAPDGITQQRAVEAIQPNELIVDALLGTGFQGEVRSPTAELIDRLNAATKRGIIAVDVPSGLDCDTGAPARTTIRADLTITFLAKKRGFSNPAAREYIGRVEVADIGCPRELVEEVTAEMP